MAVAAGGGGTGRRQSRACSAASTGSLLPCARATSPSSLRFRYSIILYAVLAGFVVWGEMPDPPPGPASPSSPRRASTHSCASTGWQGRRARDRQPQGHPGGRRGLGRASCSATRSSSWLSAELPSGEIIVVRGTLATAFLAVGVAAFGAARPLSILFTPMMAAAPRRAAAATIFIVISLRDVPLAIVNTVLQVTPARRDGGRRPRLPGESGAVALGSGADRALPAWLLIVKPGNADLGAGAFVVLLRWRARPCAISPRAGWSAASPRSSLPPPARRR